MSSGPPANPLRQRRPDELDPDELAGYVAVCPTCGRPLEGEQLALDLRPAAPGTSPDHVSGADRISTR